MLHYETVSEDMVRISKTIFESFDQSFYLAGGTALSLHLGHRVSVDLDYFIDSEFSTEQLKQQIFDSFSTETIEIVAEEKNTLWCIIGGVKVSFITRKAPLLMSVAIIDSFRLASIEDITVMKLSAICNRDEFKDYFDLACMSRITDVRSWISWWEKAYPHADITSWLVALGAVESISKIQLVILDSFSSLNVANQIQLVTNEVTKFITHL